MAKKRARKRRAWNKGLEIGKRDGFTPDQANRIRAFSQIVAPPGSEIWLSSLWESIRCCTDKTYSLSLSGMCSVAMVQSVLLLRLRARGECRQCDAPCPTYSQRCLRKGSLRPADRWRVTVRRAARKKRKPDDGASIFKDGRKPPSIGRCLARLCAGCGDIQGSRRGGTALMITARLHLHLSLATNNAAERALVRAAEHAVSASRLPTPSP